MKARWTPCIRLPLVWHFLFKASGVERVRGTWTFKNAYTITVDDRGEEVGLYQPKHPKP
jgi:hypothetical protein